MQRFVCLIVRLLEEKSDEQSFLGVLEENRRSYLPGKIQIKIEKQLRLNSRFSLQVQTEVESAGPD